MKKKNGISINNFLCVPIKKKEMRKTKCFFCEEMKKVYLFFLFAD